MKRILLIGFNLLSLVVCNSQTTNDFNDFRNEILNSYSHERNSIKDNYQSFRNGINLDYANFLRNAWSNLMAFAPIQKPKEEHQIPPIVFDAGQPPKPIEVSPKPITTPQPAPSPKPIVPIEENNYTTEYVDVDFFGLRIPIRAPKCTVISTKISEDNIASTWENFSDGKFDNTVVDLQTIKSNNRLCDWAYLQLVENFAKRHSSDCNTSSLLTAWLLCQSGFQIRIACDDSRLIILYASKHTIFDKSYYILDGIKYYPIENEVSNIRICNAKYKGETPLSLAIEAEQIFGLNMSGDRVVKSIKYPDLFASVSVNKNLIDFYNNFPTSAIGGNPLSRWAIYANTPFPKETKTSLYPKLKKHILTCSKLKAVEQLLNWVQTGFKYEYDNVVWGCDRAFFAEETLFYPYSDCEDRSILFSRLVRDLIGLEVALIYYPGHLATAVCFDEDVNGDAMIINGRKFIVCDPTYIGAPVGVQMPGLEYNKAQAIVLK